jgi:hypothetical protein
MNNMFTNAEWWVIKVWDGYTNQEIKKYASYDYLANMCSRYPASYIWSIEPA